MGVAAKAFDDGLVALLEAQGVFHTRLRKQSDGLPMYQRGLAVHEGHVGKAALRQGQAAVLPTGHQLLRQHQGQRVLRKGLGGAPVDVARELVEHQDLGQAPLRGGTPSKQLTPRSSRQRGPEAGADGFVQGGVFGEVVLGGEFGEPEVEDGLRLHQLVNLCPSRIIQTRIDSGVDALWAVGIHFDDALSLDLVQSLARCRFPFDPAIG